MSGKMLKQNAVRSKNAKLKCRKFSTLQKCEIKMQRKISVLQYAPRTFSTSDAAKYKQKKAASL